MKRDKEQDQLPYGMGMRSWWKIFEIMASAWQNAISRVRTRKEENE